VCVRERVRGWGPEKVASVECRQYYYSKCIAL